MKFRYILVIVLFGALISCNRSEKVEYNKDGSVKKKIVYLSPDQSTYREIEYYDGKRVKGLHEYTDGIQHGRSFNYYSNGNIQSVFYYDLGHLTSIARYYNQEGKITDKGLFINDSLVVKEEFFYHDDMMNTKIFSKLSGNFTETGSLLTNSKGLFGLDNSHYFITSSLDSIPETDSIRVNVNFIANSNMPTQMVLTLGTFDNDLSFHSFEKTYRSDSTALSFYYKPRNKGYNLILGKLHYDNDMKDDKAEEYIFYHDFLAY